MLKEQLAEEKAERVNLEGTLQKSRKKLARAREQRGESEQSVQQNYVDSKRKIKRTSQNKYITNTNRRIRARTRGNSVMSPEAINEMYWKYKSTLEKYIKSWWRVI